MAMLFRYATWVSSSAACSRICFRAAIVILLSACADDEAATRRRPLPPSGEFMLRVDVRDRLPQDSPNVLETPEFIQVRDQIRRVAVLPPEFCRGQAAGKLTGESSQQETLLQTRCGPLMAEFERTLTASHLNTFSSVELQSAVTRGGVTAADAAKKANVELLFVVNNLELVKSPQSVRLTRTFHFLDRSSGTWVSPPASATRDAQFARILLPTEQAMQRATQERLGAALDVTAVLVSTGQSVWFFRWTKYLPVSFTRSIRVSCSRSKSRCAPVEDDATVGGYQGSYRVDSPFDGEAARNATYYALSQEAISQMVTWFLRPLGQPGP